MGLSGYYRKFIVDYAKLAAPLNYLTKKNVPFVWSEECQHSFACLKDNLMKAPIMAYPNYNNPFTLYTDASSFSVGAVLCQSQSGTERVIAYAGRSLNKSELNYTITEKECLAVVFAVKHFDYLLRHCEFDVVVDHLALKWLLSFNEPTGRLARWITLLMTQ